MNHKIIRYILGCVLSFEGCFLLLPCFVGIIYHEKVGLAYLIVSLICFLIGFILMRKKPQSSKLFTREGFLTVALSWIILSIFGALPFYISGEIPFFIDALFETVSGFTTTGASILPNVELLSLTSLFWRSFTHWIGGMGVLVFILAILPLSGAYNLNLMRAESPGPSVSKLVPKIQSTAMILYGIYIFLTLLQICLLMLSGMPLFDSLIISFGTAGTGGFGHKVDSLASFSSYVQVITTIFMILFGINFNVYFLLLFKKPKQALKSEEARYFLGIIGAAILMIVINVRPLFTSFAEALKHVAFQVASIITTTGFSTTDFDLWPEFSKGLIVALMFIGACAGSTGGGIKVSRFVILFKTLKKEIQQIIHPRSIKVIRFEGKPVEHNVLRSINTYFAAYMLIFIVSFILICLNNFDLITNFTAVAATLNNIGPGLQLVGPSGHFADFNVLSKLVLIFDMLAGRLELFPLLMLVIPSSWRK